MSSFRDNVCNYRQFKKTIVSPGRNLLYQNILSKLFSKKAEKRISSFFSQCNKKYRASMAVEAAIALPFFFFFVMNILFSFDMLRLHGNLMGAMHQTGNKMAFYGYAYRMGAEDGTIITEGLDSLILSEGYARGRVIYLLGEEYLNHTCLASGISGLHFGKSSIMKENDIIELTASYKVKPFIRVIGFPEFPMENRYYGRAWTGYDVEGRQSDMSKEDPIVYVAENGVVYHVARNCTYLNPSITAVSSAMIQTLRNENGEKYYPCDRCGSSSFQAVMYVTSQGNKVHGSLNCSGLKRTVYSMHLSEVEGKGKCSKCG